MDPIDKWAGRVYTDSSNDGNRVIAYGLVAIAYAIAYVGKCIVDVFKFKSFS